MAQADGSIRIDTQLNTDGFDAGSKELEAAMRRSAQTISAIGKTAEIALQKQMNAFVKQNQAYAQQEQKVQALKEKLDSLKDQKVPTSGYSLIEKEIEKLESALDRAVEKQIKFMETGGKQDSQAFRAMEYDIDQLSKKLEEAKIERDRLLESGQAFTRPDTSKEESDYIAAQQKLEQMGSSLQTSVDSLTNKISSYGGAVQVAARQTNSLQDAMSGLAQAESIPINQNSAALEKPLEYFENSLKEIQDLLAMGFNGTPLENLKTELEVLKRSFPQATQLIQEFEDTLNNSSKESAIRDVASEIQEVEASTRRIRPINFISEDTRNQLSNMKNLISRTFVDAKNGEIWDELKRKVKEYAKQAQVAAGTKVYTDDYKRLLSDIERAKKSLEKLQEKQRGMSAAGVDKESKEWKKVATDIARAERQLESYNGKKVVMEQTGQDVQPSGGLANQSWIKNAGVIAGAAFSSISQKAKELGSSVMNTVGKIPIIGRVAKESAFLGQKAFSGLGSLITKISSQMLKLGKTVGSTLLSALKRAGSAMTGLRKNTGFANNMFKAGFSNILKYGLGIRSFYALVNKFRTGVKEGFANLAQYSSPVNQSISSLISALETLKNALATAFAPILNVVAPILTTFINMISRAVTYVGMLIAALTGKKTFTKAVAVQKDYAASLGKSAGAAKKSAKGTKDAAKEAEGYLSAIDEINKLESDKDKDSAGGGGGGGGGGDGGIGNMFEEVPIDSKISDLAQMIKDAWENADFTEIGAIIGQKLKEGLDSIPWDKIQAVAAKLGKSLATLINGFVEVQGLGYTIGNTLAQAINTALKFLEAFAANLHWDSVGKFIADGINGVLENIDWETALSAASLFGKGIAEALNNALTPEVFENIGKTIGMLLNVALTLAESFLDEFDFKQFGSGIAKGLNKAINTIDWAQLGRVFGKLLNAFFDTLGSFAEDFDWSGFGSKLGKAVSTAIGTFNWGNAGTSIAKFVNGLFKSVKSFIDKTDWKGLGKGITTAISNFFAEFDWGIVGGTLSSFLIGCLDFLIGLIQGIDWSGIPQGIIDAISDFLNGFDYSGVFGKIGELVGTAVAAGIDLLKALKDVLSKAWDKVVKYFSGYIEDSGGDIVKGLFKGIGDAIKNIGKWVTDNIVDPFLKGFKNALGIHSPSTVMAEQGGYIIDGLLNGIKSAWTGFIDFWGQKITDIVDGFKDIKDKFLEKGKNIIEGIKGGISEKWSEFSTFWIEKKDAVVDKFKDVKEKFTTKGNEIISGVKSGISEKWNDFSSWWGEKKTAVVDKFKDVKEKFKTKGGNIVSGIKSGISENWSSFSSYWGEKKTAVVDKFKDIKDKFKTKGGNIVSGIKSGISGDWSAFYKDWESKKNSIINIFSNIKNEMVNIGKKIVDGLVSGIKSVWGSITNVASKIKDAFTGGKSAAVSASTETGSSSRMAGSSIRAASNIPMTASMPIPYLATGAVIPPNAPFMAMLGDQRNGNNLEMPESLLRKVVREESGGKNGGQYRFTAQINRRTLFDEMITEAKLRQGQNGRNPFELA